MDETLYANTIEQLQDVKLTVNKEVLYTYDIQNGQYSNSIEFYTSNIANSGRWLDFANGTIQIPFVMTLKSDQNAAGAGVMNASSVGLKNGFWQLVDSVNVEYNNINVCSQQSYTNMFVNFKMLSKCNEADLKKLGGQLNFFPDVAGTARNSLNAASQNGDGPSNNIPQPLTAVDYATNVTLGQHNAGYAQRLRNTSFAVGLSMTKNSVTLSAANCLAIGKSHVTDNAVAAAGRVVQWNVMATLRLKDLSDFFDKMPLVHGGLVRINIIYNATTAVINSGGANFSLTSISQLSGNTCPFIFSSGAGALGVNPNSALALIAANSTVSCNIARATNSFTNASMPTCRLLIPSYGLESVIERNILTNHDVHQIKYTDFYSFKVSSIGTGSFSSLLTNNVRNPKYIVVMPILNTAAGVFLTANGVPIYQSPFDSVPGTTSELAALTNFNISLSGRNVFQNSQVYDFEQWNNEMSHINALNGGITDNFTSGLIDAFSWGQSYRYYCADLSRYLPEDEDVEKSISIQGTNASGLNLDLMCFVVYGKKLTIKLSNGAIV